MFTRVRGKLVTSYIAIAGVVGAASFVTQADMSRRLKRIEAHEARDLFEIAALEHAMNAAFQQGFVYVISGKVQEKADFLNQLALLGAMADTLAVRFGTRHSSGMNVASDSAAVDLRTTAALRQELADAAAAMFTEYERVGRVTKPTFGNYELVVDSISTIVERMRQREARHVLEREVGTLTLMSRYGWLTLGVGLLGVLMSLIFGFAVSRVIVARLESLRHAASELGNGNLAATVTVTGNDELAELGKALQRMASDVQALVQEKEQDKRRLHEIFESMGEMLLVCSPEGRITAVNRFACERLGYSEDELVGTPCEDLFPDVISSSQMWTTAEMRPYGAVLELDEQRVTRKDGGRIAVKMTMSRLFNQEGQPIGMVWVAKDVTEQKEVESRLHRVVEASPFPIYTLSLSDSVPRCTWMSPNITRLAGYQPSDALDPKWWASGLHPDERDHVVRSYDRVFVDGYAVQDYRFRHANGTYRWIRDEVRLVRNEEGEAVEAVGCWVDISDWKESQEQLRQSQKMEAVGQLAGGIAHDFNNLLTVITGYSEMLQAALPPGDQTAQDLDLIRKSADRAAGLTRQLLAFSRRQILQPRELDMNEVVSGLETMLRRVIGENIELVTSLDSATGFVMADPGQLEQVIMNLAINARDAMGEGGRLVMSTGNAVLDERAAHRINNGTLPGRYVVLSVADNGCGMSEATMAHMFEPFFTTKEPGKGTGLGLSTVYGIVKQSGGSIDVHSRLGAGTTFRVLLPLADTDVTAEERAPEREWRVRGFETILLVEDDASVRTLAERILKRAGYRVLLASNGEEALRLVESHDEPLHLVLTDVVMPNMSGARLAQRLASLRPDIRILYMTGYTDDVVDSHGVLKDGLQLVQKPFTPDYLTRRVRQFLDENVAPLAKAG